MRNRPKGIAILFWLCLFLVLLGLPDFLQSDQSVLILGKPVGGLILKVYEMLALASFVVVLWGLFQLHRWASFAFMWMNVAELMISVGNIFLVLDAALSKVDNTEASIFYKWSAFFVVIIIVLYSSLLGY